MKKVNFFIQKGTFSLVVAVLAVFSCSATKHYFLYCSNDNDNNNDNNRELFMQKTQNAFYIKTMAGHN